MKGYMQQRTNKSLFQQTWKTLWFVLDSRSLTAYPGAEQEHDIDSVLANYDVDQISSMKMIESSKKKIAPEMHLMTRQKEQIYLRGNDLEELKAWKRALVEAKRSSYCPTSFRPRSYSRHSAASAQDGILEDPLADATSRPKTSVSHLHPMLRSQRISVSMTSLLFSKMGTDDVMSVGGASITSVESQSLSNYGRTSSSESRTKTGRRSRASRLPTLPISSRNLLSIQRNHRHEREGDLELPKGGRSPTISVRSAPIRGVTRVSPSPTMQDIQECHSERGIENNIQATDSGEDMRAMANNNDTHVEVRTDLKGTKKAEKGPKKKPKKIISERDISKRPSLSRSVSAVFTGKLRRLSISTPSSPISNQSFEMGVEIPSDHDNRQENAERMLKKPPRKSKQKKATKSKDEGGEHKGRAYLGLFQRPSKSKIRKSFVIVPSMQKSGSKDGEENPEGENAPTAASSAEEVEDPPPENEVLDRNMKETSTDRTLSAQQPIAPTSPLTRVKRSPTMKERITSLPRRLIKKISIESVDGPEDEGSADSKCEVDKAIENEKTKAKPRPGATKSVLIGRMPSINKELQSKLQKWKESAETEESVFSSADKNGGDSRIMDLPEKSLRFQHRQLRNLLEGKLNPPENKKWTRAGVQALLDNVGVRLKFEEMNRMKPPLKELYKSYDVPMVL